MSDITFELGAEAGDAVTFDVGAASGDDVSFDIPEPGTTVHGDLTGRNEPGQHTSDAVTVGAETLTNYLAALETGGGDVFLAAANLFTADQRIDLEVPVTPVADAATTRPTTFLHMHMPNDGDVLTETIGFALDFGGGTIIRAMGTVAPEVGLDGMALDTWEVDLFSFYGTDGNGDPVYRRHWQHVTSSTPGEMPSLSDIYSSPAAPIAVGTAVMAYDAVPLAQMEAVTDGLSSDITTGLSGLATDAEAFTGSGLLLGITTKNPALYQLEGILDRPLYCCAQSTTNVDVSATNPAMEYGGCVAGGYVWLNGQTNPAENGTYYVNGDLTITRKNHPDVFEPPGNGATRTLLAPGDPNHGRMYEWLNDDRTKFNRAGSLPQLEAPDSGWSGEWVLRFDPTSSGGGVALGETSTTAYRGDRGKTAYDYSQAHTGATDPHGDRAYAAALVDDLSGVTDAATARTNLGLGSLATLSAIPNNGVRAIMRDGYLWDTVSGAQAWQVDVSCAQGHGFIYGDVLNGYIEWTEWLDAGTWTLELWYLTGSSSGVMTVAHDGTQLGATIDGYSASTVRNLRATRTGVTVATSGLHTLRASMLSKNASSSGYRSGIQAVHWRRTA